MPSRRSFKQRRIIPEPVGMSSLYNNIRLRTCPASTRLTAAVFRRLPFYNLLTNVTQAYNVPECPTGRTTQPIQIRLTTEMLAKLQPKSAGNMHG
jgi:hypothetical protein